MARYFDVHPDNPQRRAITQVVEILRDDGLIAYPTDSCFAFGCQLGNKAGLDRIREIRHLDDSHHFTLVCRDFAQLGQFVQINNASFRSIKAATPGSYTFILPAAREVPRRLLHPRKRTVGVRIPEHLLRYVVEKGSVTIDGISLTVVEPLSDGFTSAIIPHTTAVTSLGHKTAGAKVNIEVDVLAKYVERLLKT